MYIFRLKIHTHRRYVKKPSAETQVSTGANEKRFINKTYIYRFLKQRSFASSRGTHSKTGKNTMKPLIRILSLWLAAFCFGACTDDDLIDGTPTPEPETGIVIRLSAGDLEQTRTELTSQANLQHVETVYALLYKGHYKEGQTVEDTTKLIACDELTGWNPEDEGDGGPHGKEYKLPQSENLTKGAYTVLCVGLDDKSGETYGLTPDKMQGFSTLKDAKAILAQGKGKEDIAKSELFAGWNQFHFAPDSLNIVEVEMKRRVAGVICYLTDVPYQLTKDDGTWRVQKVILRLFTQQNKSISLLRPEQTVVDNKYVDDFGDASFEEDSNSDILMEFDLSKYEPQDNNKELYEIPVTGENQLPNTLLGGVYMIPINNETADQNTLQIELWGKKIENDELTGDEACIRSFPAINDDIDLEESGDPSSSYPIRPNIIYHIGTKPSNDGTTGDTPESLAGTKVDIVAEEWKDQEINVEFPSVPIMATMELLDENDQPYNTDSYVFDCIGIDDQMYEDFYEGYPNTKRLKLRIHSSILKEQWHLNVATECKDQTMLYMYNDETDIYDPLAYNDPTPEEYEADYFDIHIIMTDYVEENGPDKRSVKLELKTGDLVYPMTITQYNALFVDADDWKLAVSRYDWGCKRNLNDGSIDINQPYLSSGWGFTSSVQATIFPGVANDELDGRANYKAAKSSADSRDHWDAFYSSLGCAMYCGAKKKLLISEGRKRTDEDLLWYVPAFDEMESVLNILKKDLSKANMEQNRKYWTASAASLDGIVYTAWNIFVNTDNEVDFDGERTIGVPRKSLYPFRQVCRIDND